MTDTVLVKTRFSGRATKKIVVHSQWRSPGDKLPRMLSWILPNGDRLVEEEWASATGFFLDADGRFPIDSPAHKAGFIEPRTFALVNQKNERLKSFPHPSTSPIDDSLYVMRVYFVRDTQLIEALIDMSGATGKLVMRLCEEVVKLDGLQRDTRNSDTM